MKIIFLDVDGVLVNNNSWVKAYNEKTREAADPKAVAQLNRIINETGAYVVMSSSWRIGRTELEIRELLQGWGVACKMIGKTPPLAFLGSGSLVRGNEIQAWLDDYRRQERFGPVESYVILDDDVDMAHLLPHLVQTNTQAGLTERDADIAIKKLGRVEVVDEILASA